MTTKGNEDYAQRVHDALHSLPTARQGKLMTDHRQAYGLLMSSVQGLVKPDGLTDEGAVKLHALGDAVGVSRDQVAAPASHAKK